MWHGSQVWGQSLQTVIDKISLLQRKAVRLMTFSNFDAHSEPLFKELKILKIKDNIFLQNCLFVHDYFNLPKSFNNTFTKVENTHTSFRRNARDGYIAIPSYNSTNYGLNSIYKHCIDALNKFTKNNR